MTIFDRLERRWGWLAFPGFLRYYALLHALVFGIQIFRPEIGQMLDFDREKIFSGELWRLVTMFFSSSQFGKVSITSLFFLYFAVMFVFMISDGLEGAWGAFKTSLFLYTGMVTVVVVSFICPVDFTGGGAALYGAAFLAFATVFPRHQILLFFILPVQVRFLGMLTAGLILLTAVSQPILIPFLLLVYSNYIIWAGIPALRGTAMVIESSQRRKRFNAAKLPGSEAFHTCAICKKTDVSDPYLEFRIGENGEEYCVDHLPD